MQNCDGFPLQCTIVNIFDAIYPQVLFCFFTVLACRLKQVSFHRYTLTVSSRWQPESPVSWNTFITLSSKHVVSTITLPKKHVCSIHILIAITIISYTSRETVTSCQKTQNYHFKIRESSKYR